MDYLRLSKYHNENMRFSHSVSESPIDGDFPLHVHDDYEIYCVMSGNVGYVVEGNTYELCSGSLMLMRSAEIHKLLVRGSDRYERYTMNFSPELLSRHGFPPSILDAFNKRELGEKNMYRPTDFIGVKPMDIFTQMDISAKGGADESAFTACLSALLCAVNSVFYERSETAPENKPNTFERELIAYINEHLLEDISLTSLSEQMHMSPSQINRIFNRLTGTSVYNYILSKRLVYAQGMILRGESAVSTCQLCGFKDYSSFFRLYKKRFGDSPASAKKGQLVL